MINLHSASLTYSVHNCVWINIQNVDIKSGRRNIYLMVARATSRLRSDSWWPLAPAKSRIRDNVKMLNSRIYLNTVSRWHTIAALGVREQSREHHACTYTRTLVVKLYSACDSRARATRAVYTMVYLSRGCIPLWQVRSGTEYQGTCEQRILLGFDKLFTWMKFRRETFGTK